jgi:CO/xanthine dehydrogenase Mo-binding subunit
VIGDAHPRLGGERFVAGTGRFVDDVRVPGMLHAAVLRSPHAHARLVSIDTKRARDVPGVRAALTAGDVPANAIIPNRVPAPKGTDRYLQPPDTGSIALRRVVVGADVGRAVNPALVDGQLVGGVAFGIGNTLHESLAYDAGGQLLSSTLMDYALPAAADVPPVDGFYQEVRATTNPLGLRGLGECGNPGLGGAIANAVCDALAPCDLPINALPLTPARVYLAAASARPRPNMAAK